MQTLSEMSLRKFAFYVAVIVFGFVFGFKAFSQTPDPIDAFLASAHTVKANQPDRFNTKFVITLFSADAVLRSLDGYSTVKLLNDPCRCFHESDPIAPKGGSIAAEAAFQAGALAAVYGGAWLLNRHGHHKLARGLLMVDIGSEGYAVGRNFTRSREIMPVGTPIQHISLQK